MCTNVNGLLLWERSSVVSERKIDNASDHDAVAVMQRNLIVRHVPRRYRPLLLFPT